MAHSDSVAARNTINGIVTNGVDQFTGLAGVFRQWAGLGIVAIDALMLFLAVFWLIPNTQAEFHRQLQLDRQSFQLELKSFRDQMSLERDWERERTELWREHARTRDAMLFKSVETQQKSLEQVLQELKAMRTKE